MRKMPDYVPLRKRLQQLLEAESPADPSNVAPPATVPPLVVPSPVVPPPEAPPPEAPPPGTPTAPQPSATRPPEQQSLLPQPDSQAPGSQTPAAQASVAQASVAQASVAQHSDEDRILALPLEDIHIDPSQPRRYLPADLRARASCGELSVQEVIAALIERASSGDAEAAGYLASISALAGSIEQVGLLQPLHVTPASPSNDSPAYTIVDGERRLWACAYVNARRPPGDSGRIERVPAIVYAAYGSGDDAGNATLRRLGERHTGEFRKGERPPDLRRAQWAMNMQREDIPAIDYAECVWRIREDCLARLQADRQRYAGDLGPEHAEASDSEAAVHLTRRDIEQLTGQPLSRRSVFRCCAIAEKLSDPAKAIARAHNLSFRQLLGAAYLPAEQQTTSLLAAARSRHDQGCENASDTRVTGHSAAENAPFSAPLSAQERTAANPHQSRAGRPTQIQRGINQCVNLLDILGKLNEKHLRAAGPEHVQSFLAELDRASQAVNRWQGIAQSVLNR
jgi:hypothetical protein